MVAGGGDPLLLPGQRHLVRGHLELTLKVEDVEIRGDRLGDDADSDGVHIGLGGQQLPARRARGGPRPPPEVGLPAELETHGGGREPQTLRQREVETQLLELGADRCVHRQVVDLHSGARAGDREGGGVRQTGSRPGLLDPGGRLGEREVGLDHRLHDLVETRIAEGAPPGVFTGGVAGRIRGEQRGLAPHPRIRHRPGRPRGAAGGRGGGETDEGARRPDREARGEAPNHGLDPIQPVDEVA